MEAHYDGKRFELRLDPEWLAAHPLTVASFSEEVKEWKKLGVGLRSPRPGSGRDPRRPGRGEWRLIVAEILLRDWVPGATGVTYVDCSMGAISCGGERHRPVDAPSRSAAAAIQSTRPRLAPHAKRILPKFTWVLGQRSHFEELSAVSPECSVADAPSDHRQAVFRVGLVGISPAAAVRVRRSLNPSK